MTKVEWINSLKEKKEEKNIEKTILDLEQRIKELEAYQKNKDTNKNTSILEDLTKKEIEPENAGK